MKQLPTLTDDQVRRARMLHRTRQMGYGKLARLFGTSETTIRNAVLRVTYKHVADDPAAGTLAPKAPDPGILAYRAALAVRAERAAAAHEATMAEARRRYADGAGKVGGIAL